MANKSELIEELMALGVECDPNSTNAVLAEMLRKAKEDNASDDVPEPAKEEEKEEEAEPEEKEEPKEETKTQKVESKPTFGNNKWVKVTPEQLSKLQKDELLIGWSPKTGKALIPKHVTIKAGG